MHISIITILDGGQHLSHWQEIEGDSVAAAQDPIARHIADRLRWQTVARFVVVAGDLHWSINPALGQDLLYPAHLVADRSRR